MSGARNEAQLSARPVRTAEAKLEHGKETRFATLSVQPNKAPRMRRPHTRLRIPVLEYDGEPVCQYHLDPDALAQVLGKQST